MDKKLMFMFIGILLIGIVIAPEVLERRNITVDVDIEGSGDISYVENETSIKSIRYINSDGLYTLRNIEIKVDRTYMGCSSFENITIGKNSHEVTPRVDDEQTGDIIQEAIYETVLINQTVCLTPEVMNFTDAEIELRLDIKMEKKLKMIERVQDERQSRTDELIVREGTITR